MLGLHMTDAVAKSVGLPLDQQATGGAANVQVIRGEQLVRVAIRRDHDEPLAHIANGRGVFVAVVMAHVVASHVHVPALADAARSVVGAESGISSAQTVIPLRLVAAYWVAIATSTASRPWPTTTRPTLGTLWRASNEYQRPPR